MRLKLTFVAMLVTAAFAGGAAAEGTCPREGTLGVSRTVEIDTTGGPGFGMQHYKAYDFLQPKEVVLTFDDGPQKFSTEMVLAALAEQCTKATFFSIGKMALGYPEIIREVAKAGHTIGTHTWSHAALAKLKTFDEGKDEIERGISAVKRAVGGPVAPFFRFPTLKDTPESVAYLGKRNIAMFSTDIDSFDFKPQPAEHIVKSVLAKLDKLGKGIILMHDIHKTTAKAIPALLAQLKAKGYKIVHLTAKDQVTTLAEYDSAIEKDAKGLPQVGSERPLSSIVRTVGESPTETGATKPAPKASAAPAGEAASGDEPVGEDGSTDHEKPGIQKQRATPALPAAKPATTAEAQPAAPASKAATAMPVRPVPPVATAPMAVPASASPAQAATLPPNASPITTSSVVRTVSASGAATAPATPDSKSATTASAEPATPPGPTKTVSERAKEMWELWFGQ